MMGPDLTLYDFRSSLNTLGHMLARKIDMQSLHKGRHMISCIGVSCFSKILYERLRNAYTRSFDASSAFTMLTGSLMSVKHTA